MPWYPKGVSHFIDAGANCYIAFIDEENVLKLPLVPPKEPDIYTSNGHEYRRNLREAAVKSLADTSYVRATPSNNTPYREALVKTSF